MSWKDETSVMLTIRKSNEDEKSALKKTLLESFVQASLEDYGNKTNLPPGVADGSQIDKIGEDKIIFSLLWDKQIVGGIIIELKESKENYLQTLWVIPKYQNKGIGKDAINFLEKKYPDTKAWVLETPSLATRNRHFYEKLGYKKIGEVKFDNHPVVLINYKKEIKG